MLNSHYRSDHYAERRHGEYAVVVYLPRDLDATIAKLREKYDPDYNLISSHITLVFPFESQMPIDELTALIKSEIDLVSPITLQLGSIGDFYPHAPVIHWSVDPSEELTALYYRLYARLDLPLVFKDWVPHVTVAKEISQHRVMLVKDAIASYLSRERFEVEAIDLIAPLPERRWVSVRTFPLT